MDGQKPSVSFVDEVPVEMTPAALNAGVDLAQVGSSSSVDADTDPAPTKPIPNLGPLTITLRVDFTEMREMTRRAHALFAAFLGDGAWHRRRCRVCNPHGNPPPLKVDGAAYARRRKARSRRR